MTQREQNRTKCLLVVSDPPETFVQKEISARKNLFVRGRRGKLRIFNNQPDRNRVKTSNVKGGRRKCLFRSKMQPDYLL